MDRTSPRDDDAPGPCDSAAVLERMDQRGGPRVANRRSTYHARAHHASGLGAQGSNASGATARTRDPPGPDAAAGFILICLSACHKLRGIQGLASVVWIPRFFFWTRNLAEWRERTLTLFLLVSAQFRQCRAGPRVTDFAGFSDSGYNAVVRRGAYCSAYRCRYSRSSASRRTT